MYIELGYAEGIRNLSEEDAKSYLLHKYGTDDPEKLKELIMNSRSASLPPAGNGENLIGACHNNHGYYGVVYKSYGGKLLCPRCESFANAYWSVN